LDDIASPIQKKGEKKKGKKKEKKRKEARRIGENFF